MTEAPSAQLRTWYFFCFACLYWLRLGYFMVEHTSATTRGAFCSQPERCNNADPLWNYRTKAGDPFAAIDGDLSTAWEVRGPLAGDEFFEVTFDEPVRVSGVLLRLRQDSMFPTRFKIGARRPDGQWVPLAFYDAAHQLQLLERLLADPLDPQLGFDWSDQEITGIIVMFDDGGHSALGWSIPEIEVLVPEH